MFLKNLTDYRYLLAIALLHNITPIEACGWWGDGEKSSENAIIIRPTDYPKLTDQQLVDADYLASLGNHYRATGHTDHNYYRAVHFYELAAELDHTGAQYNLGLMYEMGLGVKADRNRAAGWYKLAAEKGNVHAQHHLGELMISGNGVKRDLKRGMEWLLLSARSGHTELFGRLASLYWKQQPDTDFPLQTALWATLAVENGDQSADRLLSKSLGTLTSTEISHLESLLVEMRKIAKIAHE
jgi:TPR repeat protein